MKFMKCEVILKFLEFYVGGRVWIYEVLECWGDVGKELVCWSGFFKFIIKVDGSGGGYSDFCFFRDFILFFFYKRG